MPVLERQITYDYSGPSNYAAYDRQISRMTTASAPGGRDDKKHDGRRLRRAGSKIKESVADFFGVGEEAATHSQRWQNRRLRYYKGKIKEDRIALKESNDDIFVDTSNMKYIHDPFRMPGGRYSEISSRRTTPLSSTSTYIRPRLASKRIRKDSVIKMTYKGIQSIAKKKGRTKPSLQHQRSFAPSILAGEYADDLSASMVYQSHEDAFSLVDDVFYDEPAAVPQPPETRMSRIGEEDIAVTDLPNRGWKRAPPKPRPSTPYDEYDAPNFGMRRINTRVLDSMSDKELMNKREIGMGFVGRLFNRSFRSERLSSSVKTQIDNIDDHRPYFTYWVTFVQILAFIVSVSVYGLAPIGAGETEYTEYVMMPNLAIEKIRYVESDNLWIGPRQADLIHLGAKYSPCMRRDQKIWEGIEKDRKEEATTGCCVRDDGSGCTQFIESLCEPTLNTFVKWNSTDSDREGYFTGAVCGQDPKYCKTPASVAPFKWDENDITKWPFCEKTITPTSNTTKVYKDRHMTCEISGRPCCHGIKGECMMTTREHCNFIKGYYHEDKYLCSQINCLIQICGMIPFAQPEIPDQFYRLWISMLLHGGVFHLVITVGFQFLVMRDIEKLTGCIRLAIIYVGSGIAGNLASSIFLPYHVEVGPAGAQFGILACLLVEVLQSFQMLKWPVLAILKIGSFILFLFILGLLPWIDNWAHVSGFMFGFLLAFAILPYVSFGKFDRRRKIIGIIFSLGGAILLFVLLMIFFYVMPIYNCPGCQYFNCIPFTSTFCKNMEVGTERESTYSYYL